MEFEEFEEDLRKMTAKEIAEELDRLSKMAGNKVYDERFKNKEEFINFEHSWDFMFQRRLLQYVKRENNDQEKISLNIYISKLFSDFKKFSMTSVETIIEQLVNIDEPPNTELDVEVLKQSITGANHLDYILLKYEGMLIRIQTSSWKYFDYYDVEKDEVRKLKIANSEPHKFLSLEAKSMQKIFDEIVELLETGKATKFLVPLFSYVQYKGLSCYVVTTACLDEHEKIWGYFEGKNKFIFDKDFYNSDLKFLEERLKMKPSFFEFFQFEDGKQFEKVKTRVELPFCINPRLQIIKTPQKDLEYFQKKRRTAASFSRGESTYYYYIIQAGNAFIPDFNFRFNPVMLMSDNKKRMSDLALKSDYLVLSDGMSHFERYSFRKATRINCTKVLHPKISSMIKEPIDPGFFAYCDNSIIFRRFGFSVQDYCCSSHSTDPEMNALEHLSSKLYLEKIPALIKYFEDNAVTPCNGEQMKDIFHSFGVNLRCMGIVTKNTKLPSIKQHLIEEMIARAARKIFASGFADTFIQTNDFFKSIEKKERTFRSSLRRKKTYTMSPDKARDRHQLQIGDTLSSATLPLNRANSQRNSNKRVSVQNEDVHRRYLGDFIKLILSNFENYKEDKKARIFWDDLIKPQILHDYWYALSTHEINSLCEMTLLYKLQDALCFFADVDIKSMKNKGKSSDNIYGQTSFRYTLKAKSIQMKNGIIEKSYKSIISGDKHSIKEKINIVQDLLKCYRSEEQVDACLIEQNCILARLYMNSGDGEKSLENALRAASEAYRRCRDVHWEAVEPLYLLIRINFELGNMDDFRARNEKLSEIVRFYADFPHPILGETYEELGDTFAEGSDNSIAAQFYQESLEIITKFYGNCHMKSLSVLRKLALIKREFNDFESSYRYLLEAFTTIECCDCFYIPRNAEIANELILISNELGRIDQAVRISYLALSLHKKYFSDNIQLLNVHLQERSPEFQKFINIYYSTYIQASELCISKHNSINFIQEISLEFNSVFLLETGQYKQEFMQNKLPEEYRNRRDAFRAHVRLNCFAAILLLDTNLRKQLLTLVERFNFDIAKGTQERKLALEEPADIYKVVNDEGCTPYQFLKIQLEILLNGYYTLKQIIDDEPDTVVLFLHQVKDEPLRNALSNLRTFVLYCGYLPFKNYINNFVSD